MAQPALSATTALRLGMAGRCLPEVDLGAWLRVVVDAVGTTPTEARLERLTLKDLRRACDGMLRRIPSVSLTQALDYLHGNTEIRIIETPPPVPKAYREGDMPNALRVAIASNEGELLDGDFRSCRRLLIYQVSASEQRLVDVREIPACEGRAACRDVRLRLLADCHLIFINKIGNLDAAALSAANIHLVRQSIVQPAQQVLRELCTVLDENPPPWLAKAASLEFTYQLAAQG